MDEIDKLEKEIDAIKIEEIDIEKEMNKLKESLEKCEKVERCKN